MADTQAVNITYAAAAEKAGSDGHNRYGVSLGTRRRAAVAEKAGSDGHLRKLVFPKPEHLAAVAEKAGGGGHLFARFNLVG